MKMKTTLLATATLLCLNGVTFMSHAQQLYRIVGPDGKVTFSDQPPPAASNAKVTTGRSGSFGAGSAANSSLPSELRPIATKFPVTLYTSKDCAPCDSGRSMLTARGIPFSEKTIATPEDVAAYRRLSNNPSLPFATIGSQQLKGFNDSEWTQYLDLAGYPKTSALPATYKNPPPAPMVAKAPPPPPAAPPPPSVRDIAPVGENKGIVF